MKLREYRPRMQEIVLEQIPQNRNQMWLCLDAQVERVA